MDTSPQAKQEATPSRPPEEQAPASPDDTPGQGAAGLVLTLGRVKAMAKEDPEVKSISTEACFAVTKAVELLLEAMTQRAATHAMSAKRESLEYSDVAAAVSEWGPLDFLADIVPKKVAAAVVLGRMSG